MILAITIFTIAANLYIGFAIFLRNSKNATNQLFSLVALFTSLWAFTNYFTIYPNSAGEVIIFIRLVSVVSSFLTPTIFLLAHTFPNDKISLKPWIKYSLYIFAVASAALSATPLVFDHVTIVNNFITPSMGPMFFIYGLNILALPVASVVILIRKFHRETGRKKLQVQMFMWGAIISYSLGEITNFVLPGIFRSGKLIVFGPFLTLILVGFVFYAITKYRFLDIKILILRSVTYIGVLGVVAMFYILGLFIGLRFIFPNVVISSEIDIFLFILSFAVVAGLNPLYRGIEYVVGKFFFKKRYNSEELVFSVMQIMASEVDFDIIAPKVLEKVMKTIGVNKGSILVIENHKIIDIKEIGFDPTSFDSNKKLQSLEDIFHRDNAEDIILFDDLENESLKEVFRGIDAEVVLPVRIENRETAILLFGSREDGGMYNSKDIDVLKIIAKQVGESVESTKKFRILKTVDSIRSDFVNSVSHEFRTPLTESRWKIEQILSPDYGKPIDPELKASLADVYFSIRWLVESLNQLITASDFQTSTPTLQRQDVDIHTFFTEEVFNKMKEIAVLKKTKLTFNAEGDLPMISIDQAKIKDAISIIIENAIKYSPDNSEVAVNVSKRDSPEGFSFLQIRIKDHGIGIDPEDIPHMFSRFYRGHDARIAVANGLGLGLSISRSIVELHGGKISVESKKGEGSTFFIELPYTKK